jgi:hypothetical protein
MYFRVGMAGFLAAREGHAATIGAGCHGSHDDPFGPAQPNFLLILLKINLNKSGIVIAKR